MPAASDPGVAALHPTDGQMVDRLRALFQSTISRGYAFLWQLHLSTNDEEPSLQDSLIAVSKLVTDLQREARGADDEQIVGSSSSATRPSGYHEFISDTIAVAFAVALFTLLSSGGDDATIEHYQKLLSGLASRHSRSASSFQLSLRELLPALVYFTTRKATRIPSKAIDRYVEAQGTSISDVQMTVKELSRTKYRTLWEAILSPAKSLKTEAAKEVNLPSALNQLSETVLVESDLTPGSRAIFTALRDSTQGKREGSASSSKGKGTADGDWIPMLCMANASKEDLQRSKLADAIYVLNLLASTSQTWHSKIGNAKQILRSPGSLDSSLLALLQAASDAYAARPDSTVWRTVLCGSLPLLLHDAQIAKTESIFKALKKLGNGDTMFTPSSSRKSSSTAAMQGVVQGAYLKGLFSSEQQAEVLGSAEQSLSRDSLAVQLKEGARQRRYDVKAYIVSDYLSDPMRASELLRALTEDAAMAVYTRDVGLGIIECFHRATQLSTASLDDISLVITSLLEHPEALKLIMLFLTPRELLAPLIPVLDDEEVLENLRDPGAGAEDEPAMLSRVLLFSQMLGSMAAGESITDSLQFHPLHSRLDLPPPALSELDPNESELISRWISELFDSDGIGDELIRDSPPRTFIKLAPVLFSQSITAAEMGVIDLEMLKSGMSFFLQDLLSYSLPRVLVWLIEEMKRTQIWPYAEVAARSSQVAGSSLPGANGAASQQRDRGILVLIVLAMLVLDDSCPHLAIELAEPWWSALIKDSDILLSIDGTKSHVTGVDVGTIERLKVKFEQVQRSNRIQQRTDARAWIPLDGIEADNSEAGSVSQSLCDLLEKAISQDGRAPVTTTSLAKNWKRQFAPLVSAVSSFKAPSSQALAKDLLATVPSAQVQRLLPPKDVAPEDSLPDLALCLCLLLDVTTSHLLPTAFDSQRTRQELQSASDSVIDFVALLSARLVPIYLGPGSVKETSSERMDVDSTVLGAENDADIQQELAILFDMLLITLVRRIDAIFFPTLTTVPATAAAAPLNQRPAADGAQKNKKINLSHRASHSHPQMNSGDKAQILRAALTTFWTGFTAGLSAAAQAEGEGGERGKGQGREISEKLRDAVGDVWSAMASPKSTAAAGAVAGAGNGREAANVNGDTGGGGGDGGVDGAAAAVKEEEPLVI